MRHTNYFSYVVDRSHSIRGVTHGYELGAAGDLSREIIHVEGAVLIVNLGDTDGDSAFLQSYPWRKIGSVIEASDYDLISRIQFATD